MLYTCGPAVDLKLVKERLQLSEHEVVSICANREKSMVAVLASNSIFIFQTQSQLLLCSLTRSDEDLSDRGKNVDIIWRLDSSGICIRTDNKCLLIYAVQTTDGAETYGLRDAADPALRRCSAQLFLKYPVPRLAIAFTVLVRLPAPSTCLVSLRDELFCCLADGWIHRLYWTGQRLEDYSIALHDVPFTHDQQQSKPEYVAADIYISQAAYSPLIHGFSLVLSTGRAALLTSKSPQFAPDELQCVWAQGMTDACCTAVNHRFRLISYGCKNSEIAGYNIDEYTGALLLLYRVKLAASDLPDQLSLLGAVNSIQWYPFGQAFAVSWQSTKPVVALFSTFGAQLWYEFTSTSDAKSGGDDSESSKSDCYGRVDFGPEGYQLWMSSAKAVRILPLLRSATINNPTMIQQEHVCLMSCSCVYVSPRRSLETRAHAPHTVWRRFHVPEQYLAAAWPLRFMCVGGSVLCVAGTRGFARYNMLTSRWSLFGNESQERQLVVTGGVCVWRQFICISCYDNVSEQDELRFYPNARQLDNMFLGSNKFTLDTQVLMLSSRADTLTTYDMQSRVHIYNLACDASPDAAIRLHRVAEIRCGELVPHPACVVDLQLTALNHQQSGAEFCPGADSLLINACGRLLLLSPQSNTQHQQDMSEPYQLNLPLVVAECVEQTWHAAGQDPDQQPHLSQALWLVAGHRGMRVWMPLFPSKHELPSPNQSANAQCLGSMPAAEQQATAAAAGNATNSAFISKRIMLPFELRFYPLLVCASECLAVGVEQQTGGHQSAPHRCSEVYLHHVLRQLLRRNLGLYALQIAATCRHLAYFSHVLELLLHNVLEEEATTSEPIPDPLLPRVIAFIQEFPEYLQTVAHCARKTELALWRQLFACAGNPNDLFEVCLREKRLDTAASFLIVLQSMEPTTHSKHQAMCLLEATLSACQWLIARDICRFLRAIDPSDMDSPSCSTWMSKQQPHGTAGHAGLAPRLSLMSPTVDVTDAFVFGYGVSRQRLMSASATTPDGKTSKAGAPSPGTARTTTGSSDEAASRRHSKGSLRKANSAELSAQQEDTNPVHVHLNMILSKHARSLLSSCRMRSLGQLSALLDFHLVLWLSRERSRAARVHDPVVALTTLHQDFEWPFPLLAETVMQQLHKRGIKPDTSLPPKPLTVLTQRNSLDSGFDVTPVNQLNGDVKSDSTSETRRLLMAQAVRGRDPVSPADSVTDEMAEARLTAGPVSQTANNGTSQSTAADDVASSSCVSSPADQQHLADYYDWECLDKAIDSAGRGSQQMEAELRFLQQLCCEAVCLEWCLLLCLVLRDPVGLSRVINVQYMEQAPVDTLQRMGSQLQALDVWAQNNCVGYKPLIGAAQRHVQSVASVFSQDTQQLHLHRPPVKHNKQGADTLRPSQSVAQQLDAAAGQADPEHRQQLRRVQSEHLHVEHVVAAHTPQEQSNCTIM